MLLVMAASFTSSVTVQVIPQAWLNINKYTPWMVTLVSGFFLIYGSTMGETLLVLRVISSPWLRLCAACHGTLTRYVQLRVAHAPGMPGTFSPPADPPLFSDPCMHYGTCVTHVPWCMSGSLTCGGGENVPGIPGACAPAILRIWQEAHGKKYQT